jgi:hypothetical protein
MWPQLINTLGKKINANFTSPYKAENSEEKMIAI